MPNLDRDGGKIVYTHTVVVGEAGAPEKDRRVRCRLTGTKIFTPIDDGEARYSRKDGVELPRKGARRHVKLGSLEEIDSGYPVEKPFSSIEDVREYLSGDRVVCLLCGRSYKVLSSHLKAKHDMTTDEYRERYRIPWSYGLCGTEHVEIQREHLNDRYAGGWMSPASQDLGHLRSISGRSGDRKTYFKADVNRANLAEQLAKAKVEAGPPRSYRPRHLTETDTFGWPITRGPGSATTTGDFPRGTACYHERMRTEALLREMHSTPRQKDGTWGGRVMRTAREDRYGEVLTDDISMVLAGSGYSAHFGAQYYGLCEVVCERGEKPVSMHKLLLGPQDHCWMGGSERRRFFIWKFESLWVLVHNAKGICLEFPPDTTPEEAWRLWRKYLDTLGLTDSVDQHAKRWYDAMRGDNHGTVREPQEEDEAPFEVPEAQD